MKTNSPSDVGSLGVDQLQSLFEIVSHNNITTMQSIQECISGYGLSLHDYRLQSMRAKLEVYKDRPIDKEAFTEIVRDELLAVNKIFHHQLIIPDWQEFCQAIRKIYDEVAPNRTGENANYIPILRDANPEKWGVALCTVDGQRYSIGDVDVYHTIQSVSKPLTYAYAVNKEGEKFIHQFVGTEPSGMPFNDLRLMPDQRPLGH
jgi:glutaminase